MIDVRAVFQDPHRNIDISRLPPLLRPPKGKYGLTDYEKAFAADPTRGDIFDMRGLDRTQGAAIVVRPDQYISLITPLNDIPAIQTFFANIFPT